ncbi:hypothetical protein Pcinc_016095 [Petrolisthes cinctipes]|uniref:Uncharacterized protein n=1 Tax=Petrolisthes cinctipes TaxID=88211 RepID=A0AAE1KRC3_PETCI|nr:hypothetical protein Pcinc_016095 [Petrolisthes cinctipes]
MVAERRSSVKVWVKKTRYASLATRATPCLRLCLLLLLYISGTEQAPIIDSISERSSNSQGYSNTPVFCDAKPYDRWKTEVGAWTKVTKLSKKQQGLAVVLSLPDGSAVRDKVFNQLEISQVLQSTNGVTLSG